MKHENKVKVYYSDTDSYGIVWHGAYIKWFEVGRVELSEMAGVKFIELDKLGILLPVVDLNCRYKSSPKILEELLIATELKELRGPSITFAHTVKNLTTDSLVLNATTTIVATDMNGKLFRRIPEYLGEKLGKISSAD